MINRDISFSGSKLPRSKLRGIHRRTIVMGAAAPNPLLAHSSRQQADGYSGITNKKMRSVGSFARYRVVSGISHPLQGFEMTYLGKALLHGMSFRVSRRTATEKPL